MKHRTNNPMKRLLTTVALGLSLLLTSCDLHTTPQDDSPPGIYTDMFDFGGRFEHVDNNGIYVNIVPTSSTSGDFQYNDPFEGGGYLYGTAHFTQSHIEFSTFGDATSFPFFWDWIWSQGQWRLSFDNGSDMFVAVGG